MRVGAAFAEELFEPAEQTPGFSWAIPRKRNLHLTAIFQPDCLQVGNTANTLGERSSRGDGCGLGRDRISVYRQAVSIGIFWALAGSETSDLYGYLVGAVGIELLFNFTNSRVFTVLPTASQMNWSQMELTRTKASRNSWREADFSRQLLASLALSN
jgi:hypothetical protein